MINKLNLVGNFIHSEWFDSNDNDTVITHCTIKDFPEVNLLVELDNEKILEV